MRHTRIHITNYRGIASVELSFDKPPRSNVFTLVGLNESGKTTILEAINFFNKREDLDPLDLPGYATRDVHELIPISMRSNFNERISVQMFFECDEEDEHVIAKAIRDQHGITLSRLIGSFSIEQSYQFKNSVVIAGQPKNTWYISLEGKKKGQRSPRELAGADWQAAVATIRERLPSILYFPNFLFELPDRIYLEPVDTDSEKHAFYRAVLQDVLDAIGEHTNLTDHVLARAKRGSLHEKRSLESVLLKMGSHITTTVFSSWDRIFRRPTGRKEIIIDIDKDEVGWFVQLRLKDGSDLYSISERSLGFRWFFAFLLLTQYRGFRKNGPRGTLFLFDEPASNLHPSAQGQLLSSFGRFPSHATIVYTTHSHHMVNPDWLEGTFVVKNEGVDYSGDEDYTARQTLITLHKYRTFAAAHPNQATYFQPVLDVLAYQPSKLENVPEVVMVEGKNDYYTLRFVRDQLALTGQIYLLPGTGAGSLEVPIRLYVAWGRSFVVLLDSDKEGRKQQSRYQDVFGSLVRDRVVCLEDIDSAWSGHSMESLFTEGERLSIQKAAYPNEARYKKVLFNRAIQELLATHKQVRLSAETRNRFIKIFEVLQQRLKQ
jgi:AAA ATPase-like protein